MRSLLTCILVSVGQAASPLCTEIPAGDYRGTISYRQQLSLLKIDGEDRFSIDIVRVEDPNDSGYESDDEDYLINWDIYTQAIRGDVSFELEPNCNIKIQMGESADNWVQMFYVLHHAIGNNMIGFDESAKYNVSEASIEVGGWLKMTML